MSELIEAASAIRADYTERSAAPFENAVADWLIHEAVACGLNRSPHVDETHELAHATARAYLSECA